MVEHWLLNVFTVVEIIFIIFAMVIGGVLIWINKIAPLPGASLVRKELIGNVKNIVFEGLIAITLIIAILLWPHLTNAVIAIWFIRRAFLKVLQMTE